MGKWIAPAAAAVLVLAAGSAGAASLTMKGIGTATVELSALDQVDGSKTQLFKSHLIQTIVEGDRKGETMGADCWGMGLVGADGAYGGRLRCSYRLNADDGFTIAIEDDSATGGTFVVTGGIGAFKGASGKGRYTYTWGDSVFGDKLTWTCETEIDLPSP